MNSSHTWEEFIDHSNPRWMKYRCTECGWIKFVPLDEPPESVVKFSAPDCGERQARLVHDE